MFINNIYCITKKGQASFEMMFVLAVVVILATVILSYGLQDFQELSALAYFHNTTNYYKAKEFNNNFFSVDYTTKDNNFYFKLKQKNFENFEKYAKNIETIIKQNTKYNNVFFNYNG